jgi:hypothetical protein
VSLKAHYFPLTRSRTRSKLPNLTRKHGLTRKLMKKRKHGHARFVIRRIMKMSSYFATTAMHRTIRTVLVWMRSPEGTGFVWSAPTRLPNHMPMSWMNRMSRHLVSPASLTAGPITYHARKRPCDALGNEPGRMNGRALGVRLQAGSLMP